MTRIEMLDDDDRREVTWQDVDDDVKRLDAAGRGADGDDVEVAG